MIKRLFIFVFYGFIGLNAVVKTTKILDFEYELNTHDDNIKRFINKTGRKLCFRYNIKHPKTGDFVIQEPVLVDEGYIDVDFSQLGKQLLLAGYGKVKVSLEVAKVTQTPDKKMDELCACRFKNGKKDLLISSQQFSKNNEFELYLDSKRSLACKSLDSRE
jgi:hypothetical protein